MIRALTNLLWGAVVAVAVRLIEAIEQLQEDDQS